MRWEMNLVCSGWVADGREREVGSVKTGGGGEESEEDSGRRAPGPEREGLGAFAC